MIKRMTLITGMLIVMLVGCDTLRKQSNDPNSPLSNAVSVIDAGAQGVQQVAPAAGPYGWIAGALATAITAAAGAYKVRQKNQTISTDGKIITAQQREFAMVRDTTKSIIEAIEQVGGIKTPDGSTIGETVKAQVADELKKRQLDVIGKAVISGIKAARNDEAQKMQ